MTGWWAWTCLLYTSPYIDVTQDLWSYQYITELNKAGVLPSSEKFQGQEEETRGNLVLYLYNMDQGVFKDRKKSRDKKKEKAAPNLSLIHICIIANHGGESQCKAPIFPLDHQESAAMPRVFRDSCPHAPC